MFGAVEDVGRRKTPGFTADEALECLRGAVRLGGNRLHRRRRGHPVRVRTLGDRHSIHDDSSESERFFERARTVSEQVLSGELNEAEANVRLRLRDQRSLFWGRVYATCFSAKADDLDQWRALGEADYGDQRQAVIKKLQQIRARAPKPSSEGGGRTEQRAAIQGEESRGEQGQTRRGGGRGSAALQPSQGRRQEGLDGPGAP